MKGKNRVVHAGNVLRLGGALLLLSLVAGCDWMSTDKPDPPASTLLLDESPPSPPGAGPESREAAIAKCLDSQGAVLYGSSRCSYTLKQKQSFKDGLRYINYVECLENPGLCGKKGIRAYPTWIIRGGRLEGYRDPETLAAYARCGR